MAKFWLLAGDISVGEREHYQLFGLVTDQGTCAGETVICDECMGLNRQLPADLQRTVRVRHRAGPDVPNPLTAPFHDVTQNEAVRCWYCGIGGPDEEYDEDDGPLEVYR